MTDLKREDVARVLARAMKAQIDPRMLRGEWELGYSACVERLIADLRIRPEFDAALKELEEEEEASRG